MLTDGRTGDALVKSHECPDCRHTSTLVNRWNAEANSYEVVCGRCKRQEAFVARRSITQRWREGEDVGIAIANRLEHKYGGGPMTTTALAKLDEKTMLQRMEGARWTKDLLPQDRTALAALAVMYGLDPVMGELILYENKPYITTAGHLRKTAENPRYEGLSHRPLNKQEREDYGIAAPVACRVEVYKRGMRVPAVGIGTADPGAPLRGNPLEKREPYRQALSRATRQALRMYFPHGLPLENAESAGLYVDARTGDVIEGVPDDENVIESTATDSPQANTEIPADLFPDPEEPEPEAASASGGPATNGERAALEAQLRQLSDAQGRTWSKVVEHFCSKWNHEWADATAAELKSAIATLQASGKKAS